MPIGDLWERSPDSFVAAERGRPGDMWLFVHLPKTAGSSLQNQFSSQLTPFYNIHIDYQAPVVDYTASLNEAVDRFIAASQDQRFPFTSGHIDMGMARRIAAGLAPVKLITMLRHPVARTISEYRYQRTPAHPPHEEFKQRFPTLRDFLADPQSNNPMFKTLALPGEDIQQALSRFDREFSFIGTVEAYGFSLAMLSALTGAILQPNVVIAPTADHDNRVELTPELEREILERNASDMALWSYYQARLQRVIARAPADRG